MFWIGFTNERVPIILLFSEQSMYTYLFRLLSGLHDLKIIKINALVSNTACCQKQYQTFKFNHRAGYLLVTSRQSWSTLFGLLFYGLYEPLCRCPIFTVTIPFSLFWCDKSCLRQRLLFGQRIFGQANFTKKKIWMKNYVFVAASQASSCSSDLFGMVRRRDYKK